MRSKKLFTVFLAIAGMFLFAVPSVYASFDDVSAPTAYAALQSNPAAVIFDTRSVDEHNGLIPPWTGTPGTLDTNTTYNGTPKWRSGGKTKLPISVPLWVSSNASNPDPQYPTEVRNIIEGLLARGVIDFNSPIYFLCRSAYRSHLMAQWVDVRTFYNAKTDTTDSFTSLHDIDKDGIYDNGAGGMQEWNANNLPKYMGTYWSKFTDTPPQVFAAFDGGTTFTVSILEPTSGSGFTAPAVTRVSLQIFDSTGDKGSEVAFSTNDTTGSLWTDYKFAATSVNAPFDIPNNTTWTWRALAANGDAGRGLANNALGVTDISPTKARDASVLRNGIVVDVRTWEEHQGCEDTGWTPFTYNCSSTAANARSPIWTDNATSVVREAINVPFWISDGNNTTGWLPDDATSFTDSFLDLKQAGVIDFNTPLYVMCKSGYRSYWAGAYMQKLGFRNVYSIDSADTYAGGGMPEWYNVAGLATNPDFHGPQIYAVTPPDGYANGAVPFKVGILEVTRADGRGHPCISDVSLYVDDFVTAADSSSTDASGLWTEYTFSPTLSAGSHTWNVRAQSGWGTDPNFYDCPAANPTEFTMWGLHANADGPGDRSLDVAEKIMVTDGAGNTDLKVGFGEIDLGSSAIPRTITVTNNGVTDLTGISTSLATYGASAFLPFSITNNCGSSLAASANCRIDVDFTPSAVGSFGRVLRINSKDANVPQVAVAMCGTTTGTAPRWTSGTVTGSSDLSDSELLSLLSDCAVPAAVSTAVPSVPALLYPADGAENMPTDVKFAWSSTDDVSYQVCYAPDGEALEGSNCYAVDDGNAARGSSNTLYAGLGSGAGLLFFGMVIAGSERRRKIALLIGLMAITAMFLVSCGKSTTGTSSTNGTDPFSAPGIKTYHAPVPLDANTSYNWKVIASNGQGGEASSEVWSFTTR